MADIQFFIFDNMIYIVIAIFVFFFIFNKVKRKKLNEEQQNQQQALNSRAYNADIRITEYPSVMNASSSSDSSGKIQAYGDTIYEGTNNGQKWKLVSSVIRLNEYSGNSTSYSYKRSLKWFTTDIHTYSNAYILIMSTPGEIKAEEYSNTGFMNSIKNFIAEKALDIYISGYFSSEYNDLINLSDGEIIKNDKLKEFFIITNAGKIARNLIDDIFIEKIMDWKHNKQGFVYEGNMDNLGILFAPDKFIIGCQSSIESPEEAAKFGEFCTTIGELYRLNN